MKLNTLKSCTVIAAAFFVLVTIIELCLFGNLFDAFDNHWGKVIAIIFTVTTFNAALWFFALKYRQTARSIIRHKNT